MLSASGTMAATQTLALMRTGSMRRSQMCLWRTWLHCSLRTRCLPIRELGAAFLSAYETHIDGIHLHAEVQL